MATCSCDNLTIGDCLDIPAGLSDLPRQYLGFPEFRHALIESIADHSALAGWSAEGEQDLGVMLLEMWAYVLDITQFYDAQFTHEFYLGTAKQQVSAERLVQLLGYRPRPALSAKVTLAAEARGTSPVTLPIGTGFRSEGFDDEPPQVFSTLIPQEILPERNAWQLSPIPSETYPGRVLFAQTDAGAPKIGILAFRLESGAHHAGRIATVETITAQDQTRYNEVTLEAGPPPFDGLPLDEIKPRLMGLAAQPSPYTSGYSGGRLILDGVYPQLRAGQIAVLEARDLLEAFVIPDGGVDRADVTVGTTPAISDSDAEDLGLSAGIDGQNITAPATRVELPALSAIAPSASLDDYTLHINPIRIGRLAAPALTELSLSDVSGGIALERPERPSKADITGGFVLTGEEPEGTPFNGTVQTDLVKRTLSLIAGSGNAAFPSELTAPATLRGNLIEATRGERVMGETLGSADSSQPQNRFKLKKKPLSWIEDGASPGGIRPLLEVRVDGVLWERAETLYTASATDRVYVIERDEEGESWVVFGTRGRGEPPQSGVNNVTASYNYGAGAAKPPPGSIHQVARPFMGLKSVLGPLPATGGKDAESLDDLATNAPAAALTLGRAVSVQDFAALARSFAGVLNVSAGWAWDPLRQRAIVSLRFIGDGSVDTTALETWLAAQAAPDLPIRAEPATPDPASLTLSLEIDPKYNSEDTRLAVEAALTDPETGLLAPANITIGGTLFRSPIIKAAQTVPGVAAVTSLRLDGVEMDWAKSVETGHYPEFFSVTLV